MAITVVLVWTMLSLLVACLCTYAYQQPSWICNVQKGTDLGIFSFCLFTAEGNSSREFVHWCGQYGGHFSFSHLPSIAWQSTCILYGAGCLLFAVSVLMVFSTLCVPEPNDRNISSLTGYVQLVAVILLGSGLIVFPVGLDSMFVVYHCEGAHMFHAGACDVGWTYILAIMTTAVAVFCPFLAQYTDNVTTTNNQQEQDVV